MRLSLDWLREEYGIRAEADSFADQLTMAGLEVDSLEQAAPEFSAVVVAKVLQVNPHPNADKLRLTLVDVGKDEPLSIVCGAPNVVAGMKVPCALVGAILPGGEGEPALKIKKSRLRGVDSFGMLCSARELGLSDEHSGILALPDDAPIGVDVRDYLHLNDWILDIDLTPNRGDCFSLRGLAREASVLLDQEICISQPAEVKAQSDEKMQVCIEDTKACPLYAVRVIEGVDAEAATPLWMRERLRRSGVRSISALVDISNYVMLEMGTPMHAFDADKIEGGICVRHAKVGESLLLLNGHTVKLREDTLLIADQYRPLAIAGVMGGMPSACSGQTKRIVLEAAWFDPVGIAGVARSYGLVTDSAQRFERGVDYALPLSAIERATELVLRICGGCAGEVVHATDENFLPRRSEIRLTAEEVEKRLGRAYAPEQIERIFKQLHFDFCREDGVWRVVAPSWRFDLDIADDLIEEIARIDGYEHIPIHEPCVYGAPAVREEASVGLSAWRQILVEHGYHEAICYSFLDRETQAEFYLQQMIALQNPISAELSVMRTLLVPGLVRALEYNLNRQQSRVRLFESGKVFIPQGEGSKEILQQDRIAAAVCGTPYPEQWGMKQKDCDFFDVKGDVEALLSASIPLDEIKWQASNQGFLHPGQSADIYHQDEYLGFVGALHPQTLARLGIKKGNIWVFELLQEGLRRGSIPRFQALSRYPFVRRDLALLVNEDLPAADLLCYIKEKFADSIKYVCLFDYYHGDNLPAGKKSLALAMYLQDFDKTLLDEDVEAIMASLIESLKQNFNSELR